MEIKEKKCRLCKKLKPETTEYFYKSTECRGGLLNQCKSCHLVISRVRQHKNYDRTKEKLRYDIKKKKKGYIERVREYNRRPHVKEKNRIRSALRHAVKIGNIIKLPCEVCGNIKSQGHHKDYNKPLDVLWLCHIHHMEQHRKENIIS